MPYYKKNKKQCETHTHTHKIDLTPSQIKSMNWTIRWQISCYFVESHTHTFSLLKKKKKNGVLKEKYERYENIPNVTDAILWYISWIVAKTN